LRPRSRPIIAWNMRAIVVIRTVGVVRRLSVSFFLSSFFGLSHRNGISFVRALAGRTGWSPPVLSVAPRGWPFWHGRWIDFRLLK
jgi:hypothetical protein